jgi:hypothetical protein
MTNEEIIAYQAKERAFAETDLGKAFLKFESATERAWVLGSEDGFNDRYRKATKDAWDEQATTRKVFREMLEKLV